MFLKHVQKVEKSALKNVPPPPPSLQNPSRNVTKKKNQLFFKIWQIFPPKKRTCNRIIFLFLFCLFHVCGKFYKTKMANPHLQTCFTLALHIISLNGIHDISQTEHMYHLECFCKKTGIKFMLFNFKSLA